MTVGEAMERAEELRPGSRVAARTRQRWLCEVDGMLREKFFRPSSADSREGVGADIAWDNGLRDDDVLLVPPPFDSLYPHYLCAMTDAALGENDRYAGEQAQYNSILAELAAWLRRKNLPARGCSWRWEGGRKMILSNRNGLKNTRNMLRVFGGLNETYSCTEAEYSAGINFSARNFPALSTRLPRRKLREEADLNGMYHLNGLLTVCGRDLVYTPDDADEMEVTLKDAVENGKKTLVGIGTKILIFPDKLAFDTASRKVSALGTVWSGKNTSVEFAPCDAEGKVYEVSGCGPAEPDKPTDGQLFLRVEDPEKPWSSESTLEVYSEASGNWSAVVLDYCRISAKGVGTDFAAEDTVTLTGSAAEQAGQWNELDGDRIVYDAGTDALRVKADPGGEWFYGRLTRTGAAVRWVSLDGSVSREFVSAEVVELERRVPDMDYLTECDNRVWGCSNKENVIYACKLGDPTNWFSYRGIAADSYAVTVGSDGAFTGAATCMGYALFFKENTLHKLYGSKPSDFQLSSLRCRGVAKGAARSLCVINETLYYLSPDGVMAWDGSIPTKVSTALDPARLRNVKSALGGALDGRYYLHLVRGSGEAQAVRLLVYDTERGLWQEEDVCSYEMAGSGGQLYLWDGKAIWAADADREENWQQAGGIEDGVSFELVSGNIGLDSPEELYLSRLTLRFEAEVKSRIEVAVSYDSGAWETLAQLTADGRRCFDVPFVPRRCGSLRFRLKGRGQLTLRSLTRTSAAAKGGILAQEVN